MIGIIVNVMAVVIGGILGTMFGKNLSTRFTTELNKVFGVCAMGMGISSIPLMENMPAVILALVVGTALGLACHLGRAHQSRRGTDGKAHQQAPWREER